MSETSGNRGGNEKSPTGVGSGGAGVKGLQQISGGGRGGGVKKACVALSAVSYKVGSGGEFSEPISDDLDDPRAGRPVRFGRLIYKRTAAVGTGEARARRAGE